MARTQSIDDETILTAAREVFLERGPSASTHEIARRAGVSEGTIFKRFGTKDELLIHSMRMIQSPVTDEVTDGLLATEDLGEALTSLAGVLLSFYRSIIPRMTLISSCHLRPEEFFAADLEPPPIRVIKSVMNYVHAEQNAGRIRICDPEIIARNLIGAMISFAFAEHNGFNRWLPMTDQTMIRGIVDTLLNGILPPAAVEAKG
jgi:AcrR family transcriptional regulator